MEDREKLALKRLGQIGDPSLEHRELVQQVGLVVADRPIRFDLSEFLGLGAAFGLQLGETGTQAAGELLIRVAVLDLGDQPVLLPHEVGDALPEGTASGLPLRLRLFAAPGKLDGEKRMAFRPEDAPLEQIMDRVDEDVLTDPDDLWMAGKPVLAAFVIDGRLAAVVGVLGLPAGLGLAEHPTVAKIAVDEAAQEIGPAGQRVGIGVRTGARGPATSADLLRRLVRLPGDQRLVGGMLRPDPGAGRVEHAPARAPSAGGRLAVPHHVTGVLGVEQHLPDTRAAPCIAAPEVGIQRLRRRITLMVDVEPIGDVAVPEAFSHPPGEDLCDDGPADRVGHESGLALAVGRLRRHRVRHLLREISVRRAADVPALLGVRPQTVPRRLHHLDGVPLGDTLLDAAGEDRGGTLAIERDRLIGGEQGHAELFELMLDLGAVEGTP